jgi:hypothetical protein
MTGETLNPDDKPTPKPPQHLSAKASRPDGKALTEAEIEAAEAEALAWARRANSCCG